MECSEINFGDIPSSVEEFFTAEEFAAISDYEKQHLSNLRQNFEALRRMGLTESPPKFMLRRCKPEDQEERELNLPLLESSSDGSDSEWTPAFERAKNPSVKCKKRPLLPPKKTCPDGSTVKKQKTLQQKQKRKAVEDSSEGEGIHVYPFRKKRITSYMSVTSPGDDDFLYCEECNLEYDGDCPVHGALFCVEDVEVSLSSLTDRSEYSKQTLPNGLVIKKSNIPNAGLGVFAVKNFPPRTRFGPYRGKKEANEDASHDYGYSWKLMTDEQNSHFVDAKDPGDSNWMRFMNCARHEEEQCLKAYQYKGEIYYRSHKPILAGTEILVYYGDSYARDLGINIKTFQKLSRKKHKKGNVRQTKMKSNLKGVHSCSQCYLSFSQLWYLQQHMKRKHNDHYWKLRLHEMQAEKLSRNNTVSESDTVHGQENSKLKNKSIKNKTLELCVSLHDICKSSALSINVKNLQINLNKTNNCNSGFNTNIHNTETYFKLNNNNADDKKCVYEKKGGLLKHSNKQIISSKICDAELYVKETVKTQKGIHTEKKPYKCDVCGVRFTQSSHLKRHKRLHTGEKPYKCNVCGLEFTENGNLKRHKRIHTGEKPYKCDVCGMRFNESGALTVHKRIHTGEKPYKCDVCGMGFTARGPLTVHKRIHTGEKPYKCDVCGMGFTALGAITVHKRIHSGEKPYLCDVCGMGFPASSALTVHKRMHTGEKPYKCDVCGMGFAVNGSLLGHKRIHTGEKPYKCDVCDARFTLNGHLRRHKRIHTGEKPYKCDVCGLRFSSGDLLTAHKRKHTGEKPYKCDVCGARFLMLDYLKSHKSIHTKEKPYKCDNCGVRFSRKGDLRRHKRIHTGEKPYKCDVCGLEVTEKGNLKRHQRIHTGEKPYQCDVCSRGFNTRGNLTIHKRIHTGEKLYQCDVCGMGFTASGALTVHKRMHTGEKPYQCDICGMGFTASGSLTEHKRKHTGEKPYKCDVCGGMFTQSGHLRAHKRIHTGEKQV